MWVLLKKSYAGPLGLFSGGQKYDLPEATIKQLCGRLGKTNVVKACASWDEKKDGKAARAAEVRAEINVLLALAEKRSAEHAEFAGQADGFVSPLAEKQKVRDEADRAAKAAKEKAEQKNASPKVIAEAWDSARAHEKADAEFELMLAEMRELMALGTLARLEAENAERKAKRLAKEAGIEPPDDEPDEATEPKEDADQPDGQAVSS